MQQLGGSQAPSLRIPDPEKGDGLLKGAASSSERSARGPPHPIKAGFYLTLNVISATCIVFANKMVFTVFSFRFVYTLTLLHVLTTLLGMRLFAAFGFYEKKPLPIRPLLSLSASFVGYIVFWNLSLQVNSVGFYQISKICITPAVLVFDALTTAKYPTRKEVGAVCVLCIGVTLATLTDETVTTNLVGLLVALAAISFTTVYQVFAGSKQKELEVGSMALMAGYTPIASVMLGVLVPIFEPLGVSDPQPDTLLGFSYTPQAVAGIALTCILGLLVSLSTFLVIGATSSVTYNVVGHIKTVIVLSGGCLLFGEAMPIKRFLGISLAMTGIVWYSFLKMRESPPPQTQRGTDRERESLLRGRSNSHTNRTTSIGGVGASTPAKTGMSKGSSHTTSPGLARVKSSSALSRSSDA